MRVVAYSGAVAAVSIALACSTPPPAGVPSGAPVQVALARAATADLRTWFEAGGVVRPRSTALIASRVMAPITAVRVQPGSRVRRGDLLVALDARDVEANRAQARAASLAAAETARAAEADVHAAGSAVQLARATYDRMSTLHGKGSATAQELDQATANLAAAEAQRTSAQARVAAATAARDAAEASAQAAAIAASYTALTAPFDGIITERHAEPGSMATPGAPLLVLEDASAYRLEVQIDEARAAAVEVGDASPVRLDVASDDAAWSTGRVVEIARVDPATHNFLVKIDLPPSTRLRSGLFGRARLSDSTRTAVTVPSASVIARGQLTFVYLVDEDGRARLRPISTGIADADRIEVLAGLRPGDSIVTSPPPILSDGARVSGGAK